MKIAHIHLKIAEDLKEKAKKRAEENYQTLTAYITGLIVEDLKKTNNQEV